MCTILKHRTRRRFQTAIVFVLMPLALWGGRPISGCICADGHFEPVCKASLGAGASCDSHKVDASRSAGHGKASCCQQSSKARTSCCDSRNREPAPNGSEIGSTSESSCEPATHPDILVPRVESLECDLHLASAIDSVHVISGSAPSTISLFDSGGLSGAERIVVLRRLLL